MTTDTITIQEARAIVSGLDPGALARRVWRAASGGEGREHCAAALLDLTDGAVVVLAWRAGGAAPFPRGAVVLAWTTDLARERTWRSLSQTSRLTPSREVAEEEVARRASGKGLCWPWIEEQLRRAYARGCVIGAGTSRAGAAGAGDYARPSATQRSSGSHP